MPTEQSISQTPTASEDQLSFQDTLSSHPLGVYTEFYSRRIGTTFSTFWGEFKKSSLSTKSIGAVALIGQIADRARGSVVLIPPVSIGVLNQTHEVVPTGLAGAGVFFGWSMVVGESFNQALNKYPKSIDAFNDNFPGITEFFTDLLPGIEPKDNLDNKEERIPTIRKIGRSAIMHTKRAAVAFYTGTSPFVGVAAANKYSRKEVTRTNFGAAVDGSGFTFALVGGTAEAIRRVSEAGHPDTAEDILDIVGNWKIWMGVAATSMIFQYISTKREKTNSLKKKHSK